MAAIYWQDLSKAKFIVKVRPFSLAKTVKVQDYINPTKWEFDPSLYLLDVGNNIISVEDTPEAISKRVIATAESPKKEAISNIVACGDDLKEKDKTLSNILIDEYKRKSMFLSTIGTFKSTETY